MMKFSEHYSADADCVLFEGDCRDLLTQIPSKSVQLVVTSPPYNLGKEYETKLDINKYLEQQGEIIWECVRTLSNNGSICWQVGNFVNNGEIIPLDIKLFSIFEQLGLKLRNRIVWHFGHGLHASKRFSGRYEVILWFTRSDNYLFNLDAVRVPQRYPQKKHFKGEKRGELSCNPLGKNPSDVWEIPNVKSNHIEKTIHPCQFPVELVERLVLALTNEGDKVLDPFSGVGTSLIASLMHRRKSIGAELVSQYIEVARLRISEAERGLLKIRPKERSVFNPESPDSYIPPKSVHLSEINRQLFLFDTNNNSQILKDDNENCREVLSS